ncbi:protein enabled homolog [Uloborus diversus]|uniref:protein enabled homolog n=1 Tax=Uloborus diversus TaxID=327109 RepID=UPI00240A2E15|nr:protein enabled homolog [Uloborus diversus]
MRQWWKYGRKFKKDDVIDLETMTIVEDHAAGSKKPKTGGKRKASGSNAGVSGPAPKRRQMEEEAPAPGSKKPKSGGNRKVSESNGGAPAPGPRKPKSGGKRKTLESSGGAPGPAPKRRHVDAEENAPMEEETLLPRSKLEAIRAELKQLQRGIASNDQERDALRAQLEEQERHEEERRERREKREQERKERREEKLKNRREHERQEPEPAPVLEKLPRSLKRLLWYTGPAPQKKQRTEEVKILADDALDAPSSSAIPQTAHRGRRPSSSSSSTSSLEPQEDINMDAVDIDFTAQDNARPSDVIPPPATSRPVAASDGDVAAKRRRRTVLPPAPCLPPRRVVHPVERYEAPTNSLPRPRRLPPPSRRPRQRAATYRRH